MVPGTSPTSEEEESSDASSSLTDTSYASIQKPEIASGSEQQHILLWGRFWGNSRDLAVAFSVNLNLEDFKFVVEEYLLFEDPGKLEPFDPDQHFGRFKRSFAERSSSPKIPEATVKQVKQSFRNYLESSQNEEKLVDCFKEKDREAFADHAYNLVSDIFPKGQFIYQFRAELSTFDPSDNATEQNEVEKKKEGEDSTENEEEEYLKVKAVTSPMNGEFPADLNIGETVFVRTDGEVTANLPENLQSDDHEDLSVPLEATVRSISADGDLPAGFDGDEEDYWELTVNLLNDHVGRNFIHKNTQIKSPTVETSNDNRMLAFSPTFLFSAGLVLLGCLVLAYLIFGI